MQRLTRVHTGLIVLVIVAIVLAACGTPKASLAIPPRQSYSHHYTVTEEFDRFDNKTYVRLYADSSDSRGYPHGSLVALYSFSGTTPAPPLFVNIAFKSVHSIEDGWRYLDCHSLTLLLDGKPLSPRTSHDGDIDSGAVTEHVLGLLTLGEFLAIVNAEEVEGRLCFEEFNLTSAQMEALRDVASRMQP